MTPNFELLHKYINDIQVNISENDVLELLKVKRRWAFRNPSKEHTQQLMGLCKVKMKMEKPEVIICMIWRVT